MFLLALLSCRNLQRHLLACVVAIFGSSKVVCGWLRLQGNVERAILRSRAKELVYEGYLLVCLLDLVAHIRFIVTFATPTLSTVQPLIALHMLVSHFVG